MWKIASGIILAFVLQAQPFRDLLLPRAVRLDGFVIDLEGKPIAEASIDHLDDRLHSHQTDANGKFSLSTQAPAIVIRKAGFESEYVRAADKNQLTITLRRLEAKRTFPSCVGRGPYVGLDGWGAGFQFPMLPGMKASPQGRDVDYGIRQYSVTTKSGSAGIIHGSGPMWSFGKPTDDNVWGSAQYQETTYDFEKIMIIDARGQLANGKRWRYLGTFGESASYSGADDATAAALDKVLDGACLRN